MPQIVFAARLTEADWDETLRGWRCPALAVPGAVVDALFVDGSRTDSAKYEVLQEHAVIRWTPTDQPQRVTASIRLTQELTLGTETDRWKKLAIILPVMATILSACIGGGVALWLHRPGSPVPASPGPNATGLSGPEPTAAALSEMERNNLTKNRAYPVRLGQPVKGQNDADRWFKFSIVEKDPQPVTIRMVNRFKSGDWTWTVFSSNDFPVTSGYCSREGCTEKFTSPEPDSYYLVIKTRATPASYALTVTSP